MNLFKLKEWPFHFLLVPTFFVWHISNAYYGLIPFSDVGNFFFRYTGLSVVLFCISWLVFRNKNKTGLWTTFLLIPFFFWGAMQDFLRSISIPKIFSSYSFLLSLLFLACTTYFIKLKKEKNVIRHTYFFNLLFVFLVSLEASTTLYKWIANEDAKNHISYYNKPLLTDITPISDSLKPDIFLIIFDEYASSKALKKFFNYDNSELDSILRKANFFTIPNAKSNYNSTPHSISSTLNLDYINAPIEGEKTNPLTLLKAQFFYKESLLPQLLEKNNYSIVNNGLCDLVNYPAPRKTFFNESIKYIYSKPTMWGRIERELLWHITLKLPENWFKKSGKKDQKLRTSLTMENLNGLYSQLEKQGNRPKLVVAHFLIPHHPYYYKKNGDLRISGLTDNSTQNISLYLEQVQYVNKLIKKIAEKASRKFSRPRIIIIEGDHGKRDNLSNKSVTFSREKQFMNLNSFYFSDGDYSQLYDSISPVNTFRVVLNKYFNTNLPLLKDSTILLY